MPDTDLSQKDKSGATKIVGADDNGVENYFADVKIVAGERRLMVETVTQPGVSVNEMYAYLNNGSTTLTFGGTKTTGNTVTLNILGTTASYTATAGDNSIYDIRDGLVVAIKANPILNNPTSGIRVIPVNIEDPITAVIMPLIVITDAHYAEDSDHPFSVTLSAGATVTVTNDTNNVLKRDFKKVLGDQDRNDPRLVRLGISGEVGSRTKAENPVDVVVRKTITGNTTTVFVDANVDSLYAPLESLLLLDELSTAYINVVVGASENASEIVVYQGFYRALVQSFPGLGAGDPQTFTLAYQAVPVLGYITVTVNATPYVFQPSGNPANGQFSVVNDWGGPGTADPLQRTAQVIVNAAGGPLQPTDTITVTYEAVRRKVDFLGPVNTSFEITKEAPLRLTRTPQQFIVATVENRAANAAKTILNLNGFFDK